MSRLTVVAGCGSIARYTLRRKGEGLAQSMKMMVIMLVATLAIGASRAPKIIEAEYRGTLNDNLIIGLTLVHDSEKQLHGVYYYKKFLKDISLEGEYEGPRDIVLREHASDGSVRGTFRLHFAEHDPHHGFSGDPLLDQEVLVGTWTDSQGTKTYPVYLNVETMWDQDTIKSRNLYSSTPELERNAQAFYFAVLKGDKRTAAKYGHYPMRIDSTTVKKIHSRMEFLRAYDQTFTKEYVACMEQGIPHHIWGNSQGWMMAHGAIWFDKKGNVIVLNPCTSRPN